MCRRGNDGSMIGTLVAVSKQECCCDYYEARRSGSQQKAFRYIHRKSLRINSSCGGSFRSISPCPHGWLIPIEIRSHLGASSAASPARLQIEQAKRDMSNTVSGQLARHESVSQMAVTRVLVMQDPVVDEMFGNNYARNSIAANWHF